MRARGASPNRAILSKPGSISSGGGTGNGFLIANWITACTTSHADVDLLDYFVEGSTGLKADAAALAANTNLAGVNCLHSIEGTNEESNFPIPWPELPVNRGSGRGTRLAPMPLAA